MNSASLVVERQLDFILLRKYLPHEIAQNLKIYVGQGLISPVTVARNILVHEGGPVVVIMDADTSDPMKAEENRSMALTALRTFGGGERFDVFVYLPVHEIVFFEAPELLKRSFPDALTEGLLHQGRSQPRPNLDRVVWKKGLKRDVWLNKLTADDGEQLRGGAQAKELIALLESVMDYSSMLPATG